MQELIKKVFEGILEEALIEEIIQFGRSKKVKAGTTIIDIGSELEFIPIVLSGSIKVLREDDQSNELILYYLNGGEACAMSMTCCVQGSKSEFRAKAEEDADLWLIPIHYMDSWLTKYQSWKQYVFLSYQHRFDELLQAVDSIAFMKMDERLIKYLLDKKQSSGDYKITKTHQEIANELNTSRAVVSRLLKKLEHQGKLELYRNRIEIL